MLGEAATLKTHLLFMDEQERDREINKDLSGKERLSPWFGSGSFFPEHPPWWGEAR